jgi:hypothetical protein
MGAKIMADKIITITAKDIGENFKIIYDDIDKNFPGRLQEKPVPTVDEWIKIIVIRFLQNSIKNRIITEDMEAQRVISLAKDPPVFE